MINSGMADKNNMEPEFAKMEGVREGVRFKSDNYYFLN
jgi:hypothetical protein